MSTKDNSNPQENPNPHPDSRGHVSSHKHSPSGQGFFVPWKSDASMIFGAAEENSNAVRTDREKLRNLHLIAPTGLKDFESNGTLIIAGDRGTGKSLFLARKAAQRLAQADQDRIRYLTLVDRAPFVSLLLPNSVSVPNKEYQRYGAQRTWARIWAVVLKMHFACMAIRQRNDPQARDTSYVLRHYFQISDDTNTTYFRELFAHIWNAFHVQETIGLAIRYIVQKSPPNEELEKWSFHAGTAIGKSVDANWQLAIFVDGIDEALGDPYGDSLFNGLRLGRLASSSDASANSLTFLNDAQNEQDILHSLVLDVLLHAQTGFIQAADEIRTEFRSLKCYGAVRHEAALWMLDPTKTGKQAAKIDGTLLTVIEYQKDQLAAIFNLNVDYSDVHSEIADRSADNPSKRLYGFRAIQHSSVLGKAGIEEIQSLLIRHTFGIPRQLVSLAKATLDATPIPSERKSRIDDIVNAIDKYAANTLWGDYISSVNPPWFEVQAFNLNAIEHNILDQEDMAHLERASPGILSFLYARGMLGKPVGKPGATILEFHKANGLEAKAPTSCEYFVVHPVLSAHLCQSKNSSERYDYYVSDFIVGHGLPCPRRVVKPILRISYEGDSKWSFMVNNQQIDWSDISGNGEDPLLAELDSTRAAMFLLIIISLAMKRHDAQWATQQQLEDECKYVTAIMGKPVAIHNRPSNEYAEKRLKKSSQIDEIQILNSVLAPYNLGISRSMEASGSQSNASFSIRQGDGEKKGPKNSWAVVPSSKISVRLTQPRQPID